MFMPPLKLIGAKLQSRKFEIREGEIQVTMLNNKIGNINIFHWRCILSPLTTLKINLIVNM